MDDVGEIGDLVISQDGRVEAVPPDIGGFPGTGEKTVAAEMDDRDFIREGDLGGMSIAMRGSREMPESAPEFVRGDGIDMNAAAEAPMADTGAGRSRAPTSIR